MLSRETPGISVRGQNHSPVCRLLLFPSRFKSFLSLISPYPSVFTVLLTFPPLAVRVLAVNRRFSSETPVSNHTGDADDDAFRISSENRNFYQFLWRKKRHNRNFLSCIAGSLVLFNNDTLNVHRLAYFNCVFFLRWTQTHHFPMLPNQTESFGSNLLKISPKMGFSEVERDFHVSLHLCVQPTSENPFNSTKISCVRNRCVK